MVTHVGRLHPWSATGEAEVDVVLLPLGLPVLLILFLLTMEWTEARLVASVRSTRRRRTRDCGVGHGSVESVGSRSPRATGGPSCRHCCGD